MQSNVSFDIRFGKTCYMGELIVELIKQHDKYGKIKIIPQSERGIKKRNELAEKKFKIYGRMEG